MIPLDQNFGWIRRFYELLDKNLWMNEDDTPDNYPKENLSKKVFASILVVDNIS